MEEVDVNELANRFESIHALFDAVVAQKLDLRVRTYRGSEPRIEIKCVKTIDEIDESVLPDPKKPPCSEQPADVESLFRKYVQANVGA